MGSPDAALAGKARGTDAWGTGGLEELLVCPQEC
jgi:hypothetical protein